MTKNAHDDSSETGAPSDPMLSWTLPNFDAFGVVGQACAQGLLKWQQEIARFIGERFNADMRAQQALIACRSPVDMLRIQQDWLEQATAAYGDEARRLSEIAMDISRGTMETVRNSATPSGHKRQPPLRSVT
jgi:hypothetical protein